MEIREIAQPYPRDIIVNVRSELEEDSLREFVSSGIKDLKKQSELTTYEWSRLNKLGVRRSDGDKQLFYFGRMPEADDIDAFITELERYEKINKEFRHVPELTQAAYKRYTNVKSKVRRR